MAVLIFTQMVPAIVLAIPVLLVFQALGLKDTVVALVIVNVAFWLPLIVWLLRNVFEDVPRALESAARIDGCSRLGTLFRVTIPAAAPGIAAIAILLLIGTWNEFLFAVILGDKDAVTVTRRIGYLDRARRARRASRRSRCRPRPRIVAILPCLLLVLVFHRRSSPGYPGVREGLSARSERRRNAGITVGGHARRPVHTGGGHHGRTRTHGRADPADALTRRGLLKVGVTAPLGAAFLAACRPRRPGAGRRRPPPRRHRRRRPPRRRHGRAATAAASDRCAGSARRRQRRRCRTSPASTLQVWARRHDRPAVAEVAAGVRGS